MWIYLVYFLVFIRIVVKSDANLKYINGTDIGDPNYCVDKLCILKCCPDEHILIKNDSEQICFKINKTIALIAFKNVLPNIMKRIKMKNKEINTEIFLVYNDTFFEHSTEIDSEERKIKDGILTLNVSVNNVMTSFTLLKLQYCVDLMYINILSGKPKSRLVYSVLSINEESDVYMRQMYVAVGMLISCFFLLLVMLVYLLLPGVLEGFVGLMLVSYVTNIFICFLIRASLQIGLLETPNTMNKCCTFMTPILYYFVLTLFFWSNILSFDLWKRTSNLNARRSLHSKSKLTNGEKILFLKYCLYAYGLPALITIILVVQNLSELNSDEEKPVIFNCLLYDDAYLLYVNLPIAIMTVINIILFSITAYYIWYVQGNVSENTRMKTSRNRFFLYLKMSAIMGVNWLCELFPFLSTVPYMILNFYIYCIGIGIFLILTWNKQIYSKVYKLIKGEKMNKGSFYRPNVSHSTTNSKLPSDEEKTMEIQLTEQNND